MAQDVRLIEGSYWFSLAYAARLLKTTKPKLEARGVAGEFELRRDDWGNISVPETFVTEQRRAANLMAPPKQQKPKRNLPRQEKHVDSTKARTSHKDQKFLDWSKFKRD